MEFLATHTIFYIAIVLGIGSYIGHFKLKSFSLGPAAVLFLAIAFSGYFATHDLAIDSETKALEMLPELKILGEFGLAIFAYLIGVSSGPAFFGSLKTALGPVVAVVAAMAAGAAMAIGLGRAAGLDVATIAGLYTGALTNTPALAAASAAKPEMAAGITIGYSITYLGGVLVMLAAGWFVTRDMREVAAEAAKENVELVHTSIRVDKEGLPPLGMLVEEFGHKVVFSRYRHNRLVTIALDEHWPVPGDIVTAIGPQDVVDKMVERLGHASTLHLPLDRKDVDFRRIIVTKSEVAGRTIGELKLGHKFGAVATRVRRGSIDHLATDDFVLALGDRVRVTAAQDQLAKVARFFGDQEREAGNINPVATMVGIGLGVALGAIALPLPNGVTLMLGNAGGPLVAGLVLGKLQRTGKFVWTIPFAASSAMSELGLLLFLMYAGSKAGAALFGSLSGTPWVTVLGIGVCVTLTSAILQIALARFVFRTRVFETAGQLAGSQTQPAVLVFVNERLKFNPNVNLAYSFAYPAAMISKVFIAPLLVLFLQ
jgi:putative transport protein